MSFRMPLFNLLMASTLALSASMIEAGSASGQDKPTSLGAQQAAGMYNLGLAAYKQGSLESAIIFFRRATDMDPNLTDAQYNLGVLYQGQKRYKEAIPRFQEVLRVKPVDPDGHYQLGLALMDTGRHAEAKTHLQAIAPNSVHFADAQKRIQNCDIILAGGTVQTTPAAVTVQTTYTSGAQPAVPQSVQSAPVQTVVQTSTFNSTTNSAMRLNSEDSQPVVREFAAQVEVPNTLSHVVKPQDLQQVPAATVVQSVQAVQPVRAAQPAQVVQPVQAVQAVQAVQPVQVVQPVQQIQRVQQTETTTTTTTVSRSVARPVATLANASAHIVATGFSAPSGIAFDRLGNMYVANFSNNTVDRVGADGTRTQFSSGTNLKGPIGLAADESGNIYVANYTAGTVARISPAGVSTVIGTGFKQPYYLAFDREGNLFVTQQTDNSVVRLTLPRPVVSRPQ
jgi:hypothetical protein